MTWHPPIFYLFPDTTVFRTLLRLQIKRRFAALRVEGHRIMFVRYYPAPSNLPEANGRAPPHIELPSACLRGDDKAETVSEGDVVDRRDVHIPRLVTDRSLV